MTNDLPPYDASPENLLELCEALREGQMERDELLEEVNMQETAFEHNVSYGIHLGFVAGREEVLEATTRGQKYGYGSLPTGKKSELFKNAIREHSTYREIVGIAQDEIQEVNDKPAILVDGLTRELRIAYNYDVKDRTLESIVMTFLKTLHSAGLGDYTVGRRGYSTRLQVNEEFGCFVDELFGDHDESGEAGEARFGEKEHRVEEAEATFNDPTDKEELTNVKDLGDLEDLSNTNRASFDVQDDGVGLEITINISSADWECDEVIKLVEAIREKPHS